MAGTFSAISSSDMRAAARAVGVVGASLTTISYFRLVTSRSTWGLPAAACVCTNWWNSSSDILLPEAFIGLMRTSTEAP